ncbi:Ribosome-recycling factor, mitochondrial [Sphaceloma murrayae]|uniref:Carboxylic ester hydrolase n=1 Tax=Sphaceloma murrayae TaxID=2082308 RepID=A0A2K1R0K5_9PEZI|nr:Ribosome-recycling factor, mitochondrial [Sphaceloma murrayae]
MLSIKRISSLLPIVLTLVTAVPGRIISPTAPACSAESIPAPEVFGAEVLSLVASPVENYQGNLSFCNVTVLYTHPGQNDRINVFLWLPLTTWNGRLAGSGGGGWSMRSPDFVLAGLATQGYAVVATDGGHDWINSRPGPWGVAGPGNIDFYALNNFASVTLEDAGIIGKAISTSFYGMAPRYSYWSGCSTGGRQGLMIAQRYPNLYDGIIATAPAINWAKFIVAEYWPQFTMNQLKTYPPQCELSAITSLAVQACDALDGVTDGIVADPLNCTFDPFSVVGQPTACPGTNLTISSAAAAIVNESWTGPRLTNGAFAWYGLEPGSPLSGLVGTVCAANGTCSGQPFPVPVDWVRYFVTRRPDFDLGALTPEEYDAIFLRSANEFTSIISADDPDLTLFKRGGGKMITWHGLADELIPPEGSTNYYERVKAKDADVEDYYRYFRAPGVGHCRGGVGPVPTRELDQLVQWVEGGVAPETLDAKVVRLEQGTNVTREWGLCPWPLVTAYRGGDATSKASYECRESFQ